VFRNVGIYNSDAGELPRRKHATPHILFAFAQIYLHFKTSLSWGRQCHCVRGLPFLYRNRCPCRRSKQWHATFNDLQHSRVNIRSFSLLLFVRDKKKECPWSLSDFLVLLPKDSSISGTFPTDNFQLTMNKIQYIFYPKRSVFLDFIKFRLIVFLINSTVTLLHGDTGLHILIKTMACIFNHKHFRNRLAPHSACVGHMRSSYKFSSEDLRRRNRLQDLIVDGKIILKWIL
jgi:hypothetical protein